MLLSNCAFCGNKIQGSSKIKNSIMYYSRILRIFKLISLKRIKSLTIFLLAGDKFMPELHLRQPGFT